MEEKVKRPVALIIGFIGKNALHSPLWGFHWTEHDADSARLQYFQEN